MSPRGAQNTAAISLEDIADAIHQHFQAGSLDINYLNSLSFPATRVSIAVNTQYAINDNDAEENATHDTVGTRNSTLPTPASTAIPPSIATAHLRPGRPLSLVSRRVMS